MSPEVQNHLFQEPGKHFGLDLAALNIQRGREHGVPSYNRWREWCGLPTFSAFEQMLGVMRNKTVSAYARCVVLFMDLIRDDPQMTSASAQGWWRGSTKSDD